MRDIEIARSTGQTLLALLIVYCVASFVHFAHNAEFLTEYPNLPSWLSRVQIYVAWFCVTGVGVLGYLFLRRGYPRVGFAVLAVYAALGLDGLLHYTRAPIAAHTLTMNLTIWFEAVTAVVLLIAVVVLGAKQYSYSRLEGVR